jgi:hypothetical protein
MCSDMLLVSAEIISAGVDKSSMKNHNIIQTFIFQTNPKHVIYQCTFTLSVVTKVNCYLMKTVI